MDSDLLPLSALQHLVYCPRQCALIHVEQAWAENRFTAEGQAMHGRAHEGASETRAGVRIARGLHVASARLGLSGQCDVVELHGDGTVMPVEYKRGKPKAHRADEVQVCAQAMCLEEMLGLADSSIAVGCLYYGRQRHRHVVLLSAELRNLTASLAGQLHRLIAAGRTPPPEYAPAKCDPCSLVDLCRPKALRPGRGAAAWFLEQLTASTAEAAAPNF